MPTIGTAAAENKEQEINKPAAAVETANNQNGETTQTLREKRDEDLNEPYFEDRYIVIALVSSFSLYRKANDKSLEERNEFIGSSVRSSRTLASNKGEVEAYFPNLIGVSSTNENFVRRVKEYLNNIQVKVDKLGKRLNISFHYHHVKDYYRFKNAEEFIDAEFAAVNRGDSAALDKAIENRIIKLNALESEKYRYGYPDNVADYLLYRHCLLYSDVAKDTAIINNKPNIRFYFRDEQKEKELEAKKRLEVNNAKRNFVNITANDKLFDDVYAAYCIFTNRPLIPSLAEDRVLKENNLDYFASQEPARFNKMCTDRDISLKAMIEKLIAYGILIRHPHSQNIVSSAGDFIGANMKEALAWFKNPDNGDIRTAYENQLKLA